MPIESPLVFYPRRAFELVRTGARWAHLALRYRRIRKRIAAERGARAYLDHALQPATVDAAHDPFVQAFADKIPQTHGAPRQEPKERDAAAEAAA
jgi:hypothetical protein